MQHSALQVAWEPNSGPQTAFLLSQARECLYGGAAGGGKSDAIVVLPFTPGLDNRPRMQNPKHRSIILRRTRPQLQEVIDRQQQLYPLIDPGCRWQEDKSRWLWTSGAITRMGYMEHEQDRFKFKSDEFDLIAFDELTSFSEKMYLFMFMRNRTKDALLPAIMRAGTNPGDVGHQFVFDRFIVNREPYVVYQKDVEIEDEQGKRKVKSTLQYIPAKLSDNPKMPQRDQYVVGLKEMGEDGEAYLSGDWRSFTGQMFKRALRTGPAIGWTEGSFIVRCMDYGWADPFCILWLRAHRNGLVEVLRELYRPYQTPEMIAREVRDIEREMKLRPALSVGGKDMFNSEATSGGQSVGTMLTGQGIWVVPANTDVVARWTRVNALLHHERAYVDEGMAPNLVRTLGNLVRDPDKPTHLKGHQEDHAADCLGYGVMAIHDAVQVQLEAKPPVTEHDPLFASLIRNLQNPSQQCIFPGLEG